MSDFGSGQYRQSGSSGKRVNTDSMNENNSVRRGNDSQNGQPRAPRPEYDQPSRRPAESQPRAPRSEYDQSPRRPAEGQPRAPRPEYDQPSRRPAESQPRAPRSEYDQSPRRPAESQSRAPRSEYEQTSRRSAQAQPRAPRSEYEQSPRRPAEGQPRAPRSEYEQSPRRPASGSYESRYGRGREQARRAENRHFTEPAPKTAAFRMPQWARLGVVAIVFMLLIGVTLKVIFTFSDGSDRAIIMPERNNTAEPIADSSAAPDNPGNNATDSPANVPSDNSPAETNVPADWNSYLGGNTSTPANVPSGELRSATIRAAGDIIIDTEMLDAIYNKASDTYNIEPYFELIGSTLSKADYTMINVDASFRKGKYGYSGYPQFTTPPIILSILKNLGVDMLTMCNNHMLDAYCDGLVESVGRVDGAGLDHIGGYLDEPDSNEPEIYEINGIKVGFVTYTQSTNTMENYCDDRTSFLVNRMKNADYTGDIAKAKAAGAEVIVAVMHWGEEYKRAPESSTVSVAKQLVAAGADLIIGGHPHMVQPAEWITATDSSGNTRTALCLYSMGNFLSQHRVKYTDSGIVFEFTIQENENGTFSIVNPGYVPVYVWQFKNASGNDDYRVMAIGTYMDNPPSSMSADQYARMKECWYEMLDVMGDNTVAQVLSE